MQAGVRRGRLDQTALRLLPDVRDLRRQAEFVSVSAVHNALLKDVPGAVDQGGFHELRVRIEPFRVCRARYGTEYGSPVVRTRIVDPAPAVTRRAPGPVRPPAGAAPASTQPPAWRRSGPG